MKSRAVVRRSAVAGTLSTVLLLLAPPALVAASPDATMKQPVGTTRLLTRSLAGDPAEGHSASPTVSDDGRYVAFNSGADDLVADPPCESQCDYLLDRSTGEIVRISESISGGVPDGSVFSGTISGNGRYVVYRSGATNLVADDDNHKWDVFLYDRITGVTELISRNPDGRPANGHSGASYGDPQLSTNGRYVVYESEASDLVAPDRNRTFDAYLYDRVTGTTTVLDLTSDGVRPADGAREPDISGDGKTVVYESVSDELADGDDNSAFDVFSYDVTTGETTLLSRALDGSSGNDFSAGPRIDGDGDRVTFTAAASDLVGDDDNDAYDIFVVDRSSGTTALVSRAPSGDPANSDSNASAISRDGSTIVFVSYASNLDDGDTNVTYDIFAADIAHGTVAMVSRGRLGESGNSYSDLPDVTGNGRVVVYRSAATDLIRHDDNNKIDIFAYRRR